MADHRRGYMQRAARQRHGSDVAEDQRSSLGAIRLRVVTLSHSHTATTWQRRAGPRGDTAVYPTCTKRLFCGTALMVLYLHGTKPSPLWETFCSAVQLSYSTAWRTSTFGVKQDTHSDTLYKLCPGHHSHRNIGEMNKKDNWSGYCNNVTSPTFWFWANTTKCCMEVLRVVSQNADAICAKVTVNLTELVDMYTWNTYSAFEALNCVNLCILFKSCT